MILITLKVGHAMEAQYKLICIDLDGTLLGDGGVLSQYNIDAINKARSEGAIVCIASGRPFCQIVHYYTRIGLDTPVVACNGAHVYSPKTDEFWFRADLPIEETMKYLRFCDENKISWFIANHYAICSPKPALTNQIIRNTDDDYISLGLKPPARIYIETEDEYRAALMEGSGKISARVTPPEIEMIEEYYKTERPGTVCKKAASVLMETMNDKASKWDAIKVIADHYGIDDDHICVFGDNMNDLEMIQGCKNSFAMSNGDSRIFPYATHLAPPNNENGVGRAIEEHILGHII